MSNSYSQLDIHLVFAAKYRSALIPSQHKGDIHKYIVGIVANCECKVIAINSMPDHLHLFTSMHPKVAVSDLIRIVKSNSTTYIKENGLSPGFAWQEGYGAFAHSFSQRGQVIGYIRNQEKHHRRETFKDEYLHFLRANEIEFDERYIFDELQ